MTDMMQQDMMRSSLVLPPLITSPHTAARDAPPQTLESFDLYHKLGADRESQEAAARARGMPAGSIADSPSTTLGHSPASVRSSPAMPSPLLLARPVPSRSGGKSPDRRSPEDRKVEMKVDAGGGAGGDDIITLFPRRKAGQTRPGGGRGPVVLNLELLEKFYGMPLHVAANRLVSALFARQSARVCCARVCCAAVACRAAQRRWCVAGGGSAHVRCRSLHLRPVRARTNAAAS